MRATARIEAITAAPQGHRRHRAAVRRRHREGHRADQDAGAGQEAPGHLRHQGPHRPRARPAPGDRGQERLRTPRRCSSSSTGRRRWRTPSASTPSRWSTASRARSGLKEMLEVFLDAPLRRRTPPLAVPPHQGRRPAAPRRRPADRDPRHRRGHPADPHQRQRRRRQGAADDGLRPHARSRPTTSSTCRCAGSPGSAGSSWRRSRPSCAATIEELDAILGDDKLLRKVVSDELAEVAKTYGTPRRTVLLESAGTAVTAAAPCRSRSPTTRASSTCPPPACWPARRPPRRPGCRRRPRQPRRRRLRGPHHRARRGRRGSPARAAAQDRRARPARRPRHRPTTRTSRAASRSARSSSLEPGERAARRSARCRPTAPGLALGTRQGIVKRVNPEVLSAATSGRSSGSQDGDEVVGAVELATGTRDPLLHHLRRPAAALRRRRRPPAGPLRRRHRRRPAHRRRARRLVRRARPRADAGRGHRVRLVDRAARHRARRGQGHAVLGVPRQGPRHRRRALPPLPQGRGRPGLRLGRHRRRPGPPPPAAPRSTCPQATGRRDGSGVPGSQPIAACAGPVGPAAALPTVWTG